MAIQAQMYPDTSGCPMSITPGLGGGGGGGLGGAVGLPDETRFNLERQQLQTVHQMRQFYTQNPISNTPSFQFSQSFGSQIEKQSLEIDNFILSQAERLRHVLREQRKRDFTELLQKIETRTSFLLHQKDEEIAKVNIRTFQLESLLLKLQTDCLTWQQIAKQHELNVTSLNNSIQLLQQQQQQSNEPLVEDTESCCDEQEQQSGLGKGKMVCRICERREVGVVVLPCRHLCLCGVCDPMIDLCPVCQTEKKGSVEALFC